MSSLRRVGSAAGAALCSLILSAGAIAQEVGKAASVVPASNYSRGQIQRTIIIGDSLHQNDRIRTSSGGSTQVRFLDDTMLTIGPDSEVLLDKFLFEGKTAKSLSVELTRGAMRFVSGTSPRSAYEIKTPVAIIGVRGSIVDLGFENGRLFHSVVDGSTQVCQPACQIFRAGDAPVIVTITGFSAASATDAARVQRSLDGAHFNLAKANNTDPSKPSGAAAGGGDTTGSTGGGGGGGSGNGGGGPGGDGGGPYGPPPCLSCVIKNVLDVITTSPGPNFPSNITVLRGTGAGDVQTGQDLEIEPTNGIATLARSTLTWDTGTTNLRSFTVGVTADPALDPNKLTLTRGTAGITDVHIGTHDGTPGGVPVYYLAAWTAGSVLYSQPLVGSGIGTIPTNAAFHLLAWGYTGDLFPLALGFNSPFGATVNFALEAATHPTWNNGQSAPGTFSGNLRVALGSTALHYGLVGTATMTEGTFTFETAGGLASPWLSGASGPRRGEQIRPIEARQVPVTGTGATAVCINGCGANVEFHNIFEGKVGISYFIDVFSPNELSIGGVATFAAVPGSTNPNVPGTAQVAFADPYFGLGPSELLFTGSANGLIQSAGPANFLASVGFGVEGGSVAWTRGVSAGVQEFGSVPGIIAWERWTGVVEQAFLDGGGAVIGSAIADIPINGGLHFIHGAPAINVPFFGTAVQYSLVGATSPTVADGSVAPGTLLPSSKMGVDFASATPKVGLDMYVAIGGGTYQFGTTGGAATPSSSQLGLVGGLFAIETRELGVSLTSGTGVSGCTGAAGECKAAVSGFLAGNGATHIGMSYLFGNTAYGYDSTPVTGAAAFGMDFPSSNVGGYAFAHGGTFENMELGRVGGGSDLIVGDATTPTGLSLNNFNINTSSPVIGWHKVGAYPAQTVDQGAISGVLGWERWTNGTLHSHDPGCPLSCTDYILTADQGLHLLHGVAATNIPTTGTYTYNLVGGTKPTIADGSATAGMLNSGQIGVAFGAAPKIGVDLNVTIGSAGNTANYQIGSAAQVTNPTLNGFSTPTLFSTGRFSVAGIGVTFNSGISTSNIACPSGGGCSAKVAGLLAGDQAKALGIVYQFGNGTAAKTVSGAAGFSRP